MDDKDVSRLQFWPGHGQQTSCVCPLGRLEILPSPLHLKYVPCPRPRTVLCKQQTMQHKICHEDYIMIISAHSTFETKTIFVNCERSPEVCPSQLCSKVLRKILFEVHNICIVLAIYCMHYTYKSFEFNIYEIVIWFQTLLVRNWVAGSLCYCTGDGSWPDLVTFPNQSRR